LEWKRNVCESEEGGEREVARRRRKIKRRRMEGKPFDARAQTVKEEIKRGERERDSRKHENAYLLFLCLLAGSYSPCYSLQVHRESAREGI
jgi:hypothetical protein